MIGSVSLKNPNIIGNIIVISRFSFDPSIYSLWHWAHIHSQTRGFFLYIPMSAWLKYSLVSLLILVDTYNYQTLCLHLYYYVDFWRIFINSLIHHFIPCLKQSLRNSWTLVNWPVNNTYYASCCEDCVRLYVWLGVINWKVLLRYWLLLFQAKLPLVEGPN